MKTAYLGLILSSFLLTASLPAFAADDSSDGKDCPPSVSKTVAELRYDGGFRVPGSPASTGIRIYSTGKVIYWQKYPNGEKTKPIAKINNLHMTKLINLVNQLKDKPLIDPNPDDPICADAPVVSYTGVNSQNVTIVVHKMQDCHEYSSQQGGEMNLMKILDGMNYLSFLP